jgi:CO/xanthine dehydrogenase FAD-binding subunit
VQAYFLPEALDDAVGLLAEHGPSLLVIAGGTIAMPLINEGISLPQQVMGLRHVGLDYVRQANGTVALGATTTLNRLAGLTAVPMVQQAARNAAGWSVRNMATVGGNIFAPPPAGDVAVALLALDSRMKLVGPGGERLVPLSDFYTGFMTNELQADELLTEIEVPVPAGETIYIKYGRKQLNTPSIVTVAVHLVWDGNRVKQARIALNAVGSHPFLAEQAEAALIGSPLNTAAVSAAAAAAAAECDPFTDAVASETYRRKMVDLFVRRALIQLAERGN